jgi:hypothetical protein
MPFSSVTSQGQAAPSKQQAAGSLYFGMCLVAINGVDQEAVGYQQVKAAMKVKPCKMTFRDRCELREYMRHQNMDWSTRDWYQSGTYIFCSL